MGNLDIAQFILYMVALVFSLSLHEAGHAWMSNRFGDDLARLQGRISLNPVVHVDPLGTLLLPAIVFFTGAPLIGWAKPTPVNPLRWRNKRVANFWVSAAGVLCNLSVAIIAGLTMRLLFEFDLVNLGLTSYGGLGASANSASLVAEGGAKLLSTLFSMNVALAFFNLLPVPPLDGSKILSSILPQSFEPAIEMLERFGPVLLILLVFTRSLGPLFRLVMPIASFPFIIGLN